jgi:glycosyltransferase involved in cell wall biosynthesis
MAAAALPHILILCHSELRDDARLMRQIAALREVGVVSTAAFSPSGLETGTFHELGADTTILGLPPLMRKLTTATWGVCERMFRSTGSYEALYWSPALRHAKRRLRGSKADLIVANDISTLPLAFAIAGTGTPVLFDAHEYHPGQHRGDSPRARHALRASEQLCRKFMPLAAHCLTVSDAVAEAYAQLVGIRPTVVTNAPKYEELSPSGPTPGRIRLVHHGGVFPQRGVAELLQMMDALGPAYELHLYLMGRGGADHTAFERMASQRGNVFMHAPVSPADVPRTIGQYDIGIHRLPPGIPNYEYALPNKLFDYIQARLAIVVSPSRAMSELVQRHQLGVVASGHLAEDLAAAVRSLTPERIAAFKQNAHERAYELSSAGNMAVLVRIARELLERSSGERRPAQAV